MILFWKICAYFFFAKKCHLRCLRGFKMHPLSPHTMCVIKNKLFPKYFSRILPKHQEHLFFNQRLINNLTILLNFFLLPSFSFHCLFVDGLKWFWEKRKYLKTWKNERKRQKTGFSNSNLGSRLAKIINLPWNILSERCIKEWRVVQIFWPINWQRFSNLHNFFLEKQLIPYIFEGLNIGF